MSMKTNAIIGILVSVVIFVSLLPTIADQIAGVGGNVTGASLVLIGLVPLFIVIGFIVSIVKYTGAGK